MYVQKDASNSTHFAHKKEGKRKKKITCMQSHSYAYKEAQKFGSVKQQIIYKPQIIQASNSARERETKIQPLPQ
jgi:hypothetical protein